MVSVNCRAQVVSCVARDQDPFVSRLWQIHIQLVVSIAKTVAKLRGADQLKLPQMEMAQAEPGRRHLDFIRFF